MSEPVVFRVRLADRSSGRDVVAHSALGALAMFAAELIDDNASGIAAPPIKALASVTAPNGDVHTIRLELGYQVGRAVMITEWVALA